MNEPTTFVHGEIDMNTVVFTDKPRVDTKAMK